MCIHVCMYKYVYTYIYWYTYISINIYTYLYAHTLTLDMKHICAYVYTHVNTDVYSYLYMMYIRIKTYTCTKQYFSYTIPNESNVFETFDEQYACKYVYMCMHAYMHV